MRPVISKSDYIKFLQHPAWLWLQKYAKDKLPRVDDNLQAVFDAGHLFESYAEKLFTGGVTIGFSDYDEYQSMPARTKTAFDGKVGHIFQGRFEANNITCICDVVTRVDNRTVDLYEIKSSTDTKPIQEHDLAFQLVVLESCGYRVRNIGILCVNSQYVRHGDIDPQQLVQQQDVTAAVREKQADTVRHIAKAFAVLKSPAVPDLSPASAKFGSLKEWLEIYRTLVPVEPGSIYDLCRLNPDLIGELEKRKVQRIADIPADIKLNPFQQIQIRATRENRVIIDSAAIGQFLARLTFPLYFLDYETLSSAIPLFDGQKPYQQVPFQYSLHILDSPEAKIRHCGYLHSENTNPIIPLTKSLESNIGRTGSVLVWYESFEKSRNTEMGCTDDACFLFYDQLNKRIVDLMDPFSKGWYVHPDFLGSASIKKVLPVMVPGLSYKNLAIQEGNTAQRLWMETILGGKNLENRDQVLDHLNAYCLLDTLAMVEIYTKLTLL